MELVKAISQVFKQSDASDVFGSSHRRVLFAAYVPVTVFDLFSALAAGTRLNETVLLNYKQVKPFQLGSLYRPRHRNCPLCIPHKQF